MATLAAIKPNHLDDDLQLYPNQTFYWQIVSWTFTQPTESSFFAIKMSTPLHQAMSSHALLVQSKDLSLIAYNNSDLGWSQARLKINNRILHPA